MKISRCSVLTLVSAFLVISLLMWPAFVLASAVLGFQFSDGELISNLYNQPKRLLVADFIEGYKHTLPFTCVLGLLSVLILQLYRNAVFRSIFIIGLPSLLAAILALVFLPFSFVGILLVLKVFFIFIFIYAVFAYILQGCGHA